MGQNEVPCPTPTPACFPQLRLPACLLASSMQLQVAFACKLHAAYMAEESLMWFKKQLGYCIVHTICSYMDLLQLRAIRSVSLQALESPHWQYNVAQTSQTFVYTVSITPTHLTFVLLFCRKNRSSYLD